MSQVTITLELIPVSVALSIYEYFYSPPVPIYQYVPGWREALFECLAREHSTMSPARAQTW